MHYLSNRRKFNKEQSTTDDMYCNVHGQKNLRKSRGIRVTRGD